MESAEGDFGTLHQRPALEQVRIGRTTAADAASDRLSARALDAQEAAAGLAQVPSLREPDLRPLQQPLAAADLRAARRWPREHRQPRDLPAVGLAVAGWVLLLPGALIALASDGSDPAMAVVGGLMTGLGSTLLVWRVARRRAALQRTARLLRFADANGLGYAQRALLDAKPAAVLRQGFDRLARDVLRAEDGGEWGVWRYRLPERRGSEELRGYLEVPWSAPEAPRGLGEELAAAPLPLDLELAGGTLTVTARTGWRVDDPAVQSLVHRIRSVVAAQRGPAAAGQEGLAIPMPHAIASTAEGRHDRAVALVAGAAIALAAIGAAFLQAMLRQAS